MRTSRVGAALGLGLLAVAGLAAPVLWAGAAHSLPVGPFTEPQASAGHAAYDAACAACHLPSLGGSGEAPPMAGSGFVGSWGARSTKDLFGVIKATMPLGAAGSLSDDEYLKIVAYLLAANGAKAGPQPLTAATEVRIDTVATGVVTRQAAAPKPAAGEGARAAPAQHFGISVAGQVKTYAPVTDAMLRKPPARDWLMHLHDYQGWSYSPLKQVTAKNVGALQLKWVWAMEEGGRQQINPLVHDGVMFLSNNYSNIVQALDARTGELIWENRIGPVSTGESNATRTMGLYGNLLIYPATDATLYGSMRAPGRSSGRPRSPPPATGSAG